MAVSNTYVSSLDPSEHVVWRALLDDLLVLGLLAQRLGGGGLVWTNNVAGRALSS
jgi:hypothetical protein